MGLLPQKLWDVISIVIRFPTLLPREQVAFFKSIGKHLPIETDPYTRVAVFTEAKDWEKWYLPKDGVKGKRILDVGAGSGETAWFFFNHGAESVVCIEPDKPRFDMLLRNAKKFNWNVQAYNRKFRQSDLFDFHPDLAKLDCEGGEDALLGLTEAQLPPLLMEIHYPERMSRFRKEFPNMEITEGAHKNLWMARWKA